MNFVVIIPGRLHSSRLPGKVLLEIGGLPMIEQVRRRGLESGAARVVVATDHPEVAERVQAFGGEALLTDPSHRCGSERLAEAVRTLGLPDDAVVVNLQGDEPGMAPLLIQAVARPLMERPEVPMATAAVPITCWEELNDPHVVKVVLAGERALYFSRAPIPWERDRFPLPPGEVLPEGLFWRHLGLYAYRARFLQEYAAWPPSPLELCESLEQLRAVERGVPILVHRAEAAPLPGVDTLDDLARIRGHFEGVV